VVAQLTAWKDLLKSAALIFVSASKFDEHTLFDGKAAPLVGPEGVSVFRITCLSVILGRHDIHRMLSLVCQVSDIL